MACSHKRYCYCMFSVNTEKLFSEKYKRRTTIVSICRYFTVSLKKDRMLDLFKGKKKKGYFFIMVYNVTHNFSNFSAT